MRQLTLRPLATRLLAALLLLALSSPRAADAARVVAIGDIHGAYDPLVEILQAAGLVDEELAWSGGDATLVQLGDFTDRGPRVRAVMDLLMRLQQEAPAAGGRVEVLLGNHEALNLVGERRDVSHLTLLEFSSESSGAALEEEYRAVVRAARARARATGSPRPASDASARETWMRGHPPGTLAYLESLLPDGHYGRWLRSLPTVTVIDGLLFLHAGLRPELATRSPDEINRQVWDEVRQLDACRQALGGAGYLTLTSTTSDLVRIGFAMLDQFAAARDAGKLGADQEDLFATLGSCVDYENWYLFSPEGPLWFRGYADPRPDRGDRGSYGWTDAEGLPAIARILTAQGVRHVIVGHNTGSDGAIRVRFGGRAFLIDTGMLSEVYGGKPSALEIVDGVFTAIYADRREELWTSSRTAELAVEGVTIAEAALPAPGMPPWRWYGPEGEPLPFRGLEELEDFLRTAEIVSHETIDQGINRPLKVVLERDGVRAHAVFRTVSVDERAKQGPEGRFYRNFRDSYQFEPAAYKLGRTLGIDRIPPAVPRVYRGKQGSLQAWVEQAMTEARRLEQKLHPPDALSWARQQVERQVFDALINNHDRNTGNELIDRHWTIWLIDHTRGFQTEYGDERIEELRRITPELWSALRSVERARVRTMLQPFLRPIELDALFARWDQIVLRFRTLIAEHGADNILLRF